MKSTKRQSLSGGDYPLITPMKSKDISWDVLKKAALPDPTKIKLPTGSGSGAWWGGSGADAGPSWDMPAPPKKKKGNVWGVIINIIGGLANAGTNIIGASGSQRHSAREADHTELFSYLQRATATTQPQPAKAGVIDPGAIEFILLLSAGGFFLSEALKYYRSERKEPIKKLSSKRKKI